MHEPDSPDLTGITEDIDDPASAVGRLPDMDRTDTDGEVTPAGEESIPEKEGVRRRTILLGAAASAGVVAANVAPTFGASSASGSPAVARMPVVARMPAAVTQVQTQFEATQVHVAPTGDLPDGNAQQAIATLEARNNSAQFIEDLQVALTLVDDFLGGNIVDRTMSDGSIGQLGWNTIPPIAPPTTAPAPTQALKVGPPGVVLVFTGGNVGGWRTVTLGGGNLFGNALSKPKFLMCEWRILPQLLSPPTQPSFRSASCWFGLHDVTVKQDNSFVVPTKGLFFRYTPDDNTNTWWAVSGNGGGDSSPTTVKQDTGVAVQPTPTATFHRFRIVYTDGVASFYIDRHESSDPATLQPKATITNVLFGGSPFAPAASVQQTNSAQQTGSTPGNLFLDYFALRWETTR